MNPDKKSDKKNPLLPILIILVILIAAGAGFAVAKLGHQESVAPENPEGGSYDTVTEGTIEYEGKTYKLNRDVETVLFLGVDYGSEEEAGTRIGTGMRADSIFLFVLDNSDNTARVIPISRDTITDVEAYDDKGYLVYTKPMQITMQYAFGDSPKRSCYLMKKAVSNLLYGAKIDSCLSITLEGVNAIVDKIGGLELTMPEDYSYIDPAYTQGATVTLSGPEVERFIRYRDTEVSGSNEERVKRQSWLIGELFKKLKAAGNSDMIERMLDAADEYIESDVSGETIKKISGYSMDQELTGLPGEVTEGELHDEFHVDEEALKGLVVETFYVPAD